MGSFAKQLASILLSFLIPPRPSERIVSSLSARELRTLVRSESGVYEALLPYHEPRVKALVWELKYYGSRKACELAGELLAERVAEICAEELSSVLLVPIPMHASRRRTRGGNHAEMLCRDIERRTGCRVEPLLIKERETRRQVELSAGKRRENLRDSFAIRDTGRAQRATCVILDDVTTTGATFEEATRALAASGVSRVICLALARS